MSDPIFEYFIEIEQPIFTHYNFLPAYIDSYIIAFFINQEPSVQLQVRQETIINNTVHLSTFPINILYDSAAWHEIQTCIQTASQYSHLNFITQHPATAQAVEPTPNEDEMTETNIPDNPESPDIEIISDYSSSTSPIPPEVYNTPSPTVSN